MLEFCENYRIPVAAYSQGAIYVCHGHLIHSDRMGVVFFRLLESTFEVVLILRFGLTTGAVNEVLLVVEKMEQLLWYQQPIQ